MTSLRPHTLVNRVVAQRLSHFIGSLPILRPLGGSVAEVRRTQEKNPVVPMEAVPRSSDS